MQSEAPVPDALIAGLKPGAPEGAPGGPAVSVRGLFFRTCFAAVMGAMVAQGAVAVWPAPGRSTEVIGFAAWAHLSPVVPTVYYLAMLVGGLVAFSLEPRLKRWQAGVLEWRLGGGGGGDSRAPGDAVGALVYLPWLWVVGAAGLPWKPEYASALVLTCSCAWFLAVGIAEAARDSQRWRRGQMGLAVAVVGYGVGLAMLDLLPGRTRGVLSWYNPLMVGGSIGLIVAVWWLWGRRLSQAGPGRDGFVRAAWRLLPLSALPLWGMVRLSACSPWGGGGVAGGGGAAGPVHFVAILSGLAVLGTAGIFALAAQGLGRLARAEKAEIAGGGVGGAGGESAEFLLSRITWIVWPVIFFALVYERNLRLLDFSAKGVPFDFMHWGEWWGPWWDLHFDPARTLWVDVFPIHGYGCDILPCSIAEWCGDPTLSGRFQVTAFLNAASFVAFYACLAGITRRRSAALLAVLVILWEEPSWFKVWLSDSRYLPMYLWVLAALGVGSALRKMQGQRAVLLTCAAVLGVLPLCCFLTSVDVGYVAVVATGLAAAGLILFSRALAVEGARARLAGIVAGATMAGSFAVFLAVLGERRAAFLDYHFAMLQGKGAFDFMPLGFADELNLVKGIYVFIPPVVVALTVLVAVAGQRWATVWTGSREADVPALPRWQFGPLAVAVITALYFKKGLDRADTAHFEQAAVLAPVLLGFLLGALDLRAAMFKKPALGFLLGATLLLWLGARQGVDTLASHAAWNESWAGQGAPPETNLTLARDRVGTLRCASDRFQAVAEALAYIETHSRADEFIYDFTNSGLWPFLANRGNAARYSQTFHALSRHFQEQVLADLERRRPVLILFPDQCLTVDFVDLALRQHWIAAWLLKHYEPAAHAGYYVMLVPRDPTWRSKGPVERPAGVPLPPGAEWSPKPDPNFTTTTFIWQQDHGYLPRALADDGPPVPGAVVAECGPGRVDLTAAPDLEGSMGGVADRSLWRGVLVRSGDLRTAWLFESSNAAPVLHIPLLKPLAAGDADWMEIEFAVSGGTGGGLSFDAGPAGRLSRTEQWDRRMFFKIEPVKSAGQSRRYRFHLAAMPDWMFQTAPVVALDFQPTDTMGVTFAVDRIRFWKDAER